ncbi:MAG: Signal transduction histidine kinase [Candidatus Moranbacteria bacterium GW2011_GWA2_39_41]|nr:MAG: Signal transduction histidine kinase [Candidatus Moranbacteria bacterium GW2011_GWA2_39_41]
MEIVNDFNLKKQAEELGVSVWKTPSFLLIVMGFVIVAAMTATYFVSQIYDQPEVLIGAESLVVSIILIIGNSIIRQVEEMAKLNKMKTEFVSVASHQLRTPLSAIRWETELLLSKFSCGLDAKQCKGIETINTLATRMTRLVNDLLDVTRIDQGRLILKKEKVDMMKIVDETIANFLPLAKVKNLHIMVNKKNKKSTVVADKEKIKLVLENLLSNSIKYTPNRGKIEVSLAVVEGFLVFSIRDNGVGIPKEQQNHVFSKFFRSDNAVRYQTEGTGLGLYIAKNIVEQLGGKIWFQSIEEVGSVFSFSLPLV